MKKIQTVWWIIGFVIIAGLLGWSRFSQSSDPNVVARNGLHWHPELAIYVDGEKQEIPASIGLVGGHQPMHTHTEDAAQGVIHLEFGSVVRQNDLRIGNFFTAWGKDIKSGFGTLTRMTVNGKDNAEYENYRMREGDKVELFYESDGALMEGNRESLIVPASGVDLGSVDEMNVKDGASEPQE